jgi:hypothetical protein
MKYKANGVKTSLEHKKLWIRWRHINAPEAPRLHRQKSGHLSIRYIFIASCIMRFSWSTSYFSFQFCLVLFAAINGWTPTNFFWRSCPAFHLPRTLGFSFLSFQ